jgi:hypothetical protein
MHTHQVCEQPEVVIVAAMHLGGLFDEAGLFITPDFWLKFRKEFAMKNAAKSP